MLVTCFHNYKISKNQINNSLLRHIEGDLYIWKSFEVERYLIYILKDSFPVKILALISNQNDIAGTSPQSENDMTSIPMGKINEIVNIQSIMKVVLTFSLNHLLF